MLAVVAEATAAADTLAAVATAAADMLAAGAGTSVAAAVHISAAARVTSAPDRQDPVRQRRQVRAGQLCAAIDL
jgi:hypothetical protein